MFFNCVGFIKIDILVISDLIINYIEVFDGFRVYLEIYEWVKKMVVDVLEYDEVMNLLVNCFVLVG